MHLAEMVFALLKEANERGETAKFRADFPPSNVIFDKKLRKKLRDIDQICPLGGENVLFIVSQSDPEGWHKKLYLLEGERVSVIADGVITVGKSKRNEIYALLRRGEIELVKGYDGRLHKLRLGAGQDSHTIGNGNHKEEFRLIAYEDKIYRW